MFCAACQMTGAVMPFFACKRKKEGNSVDFTEPICKISETAFVTGEDIH
jgi:hypothetical protein